MPSWSLCDAREWQDPAKRHALLVEQPHHYSALAAPCAAAAHSKRLGRVHFIGIIGNLLCDGAREMGYLTRLGVENFGMMPSSGVRSDKIVIESEPRRGILSSQWKVGLARRGLAFVMPSYYCHGKAYDCFILAVLHLACSQRGFRDSTPTFIRPLH